MKKLLSLVIVILLLLSVLVGCSKSGENGDDNTKKPDANTEDVITDKFFLGETSSLGDIEYTVKSAEVLSVLTTPKRLTGYTYWEADSEWVRVDINVKNTTSLSKIIWDSDFGLILGENKFSVDMDNHTWYYGDYGADPGANNISGKQKICHLNSSATVDSGYSKELVILFKVPRGTSLSDVHLSIKWATKEAKMLLHNFKLTYSVFVGGSIDGTLSQTVNEGEDGTKVTALPDDNYRFIEWSDGVKTAERQDTNVTETIIVTAKFEEIIVTLNYLADIGGSISGEANQSFDNGQDGTAVTAIADIGYRFWKWSDDIYTAERTDQNVTLSKTVTAEFVETVTLTYNAGVGGTISGETQQTIDKRKDGATVTAIADNGYRFVKWSDDVNTAERQDTYVTENLTFTAEFELISTVTLTYIAGVGGSISGETVQTLYAGGWGATVTAIANEGYEFLTWSDGNLSAERTDINVFNNLTVTAQFEQILDGNNPIETATLIYAADTGGSIGGNTSQMIAKGSNGTTVTAVPDNGYRFVGWSDGVTTTDRQDINVIENLSVTAEFELIPVETVALIYAAGTGGSISGNTSQMIAKGSNGTTVTAVPDSGYLFVSWSDGVTTAARQDNYITENLSVTAEFQFIGSLPEFAGGIGTETHPYQLSTSEHLRNIALYPSAYFILIEDIILAVPEEGQSNFVSLLSDETPFNGVLDGGGFAIKNLTIISSSFYAGLFECIGSNGRVINLSLLDADITAANYGGILSGISFGEIENVTVSGKVTYVNQNTYKVFIGGITGRSENTIKNSSAKVQISAINASGESYFGGIAGYASTSPITDSSAEVEINISSSSSSNTYAGGITGYSSNDSTISDCYSIGDISATSDNFQVHAGGISGYTESSISNSYSTGNISATATNGSACAGGITGQADNSFISNSYSTGDISATGDYDAYSGGIAGYSYFSSISESYSTGKISVTSGNSSAYAGGIAGYAYPNSISESYSTSNISATSENNSAYAGGIAGYTYPYSSISNSYSTGDISATGNSSAYAGGIAGYSSSISNSYSTGNISATSENSSAYAGGIAGYAGSPISNSYTLSKIKVLGSTVYVGGIVGYTTNTITNCHWLYHEDGNATYAVGLSSSYGIPVNYGATKHTSEIFFFFDINGGIDIAPISAFILFTLPKPTRENYVFAGWYLDLILTIPAMLPLFFTENTTLYAKWIKVDGEMLTTSDGIALDENGVITGIGTCVDTEIFLNEPEIADNAFAHYEGLEIIHIGENVERIGSHAFDYIMSLKIVIFYSAIPPILGQAEGIFYSTNQDLIIYVPSGSVELYEEYVTELNQHHVIGY